MDTMDKLIPILYLITMTGTVFYGAWVLESILLGTGLGTKSLAWFSVCLAIVLSIIKFF